MSVSGTSAGTGTGSTNGSGSGTGTSGSGARDAGVAPSSGGTGGEGSPVPAMQMLPAVQDFGTIAVNSTSSPTTFTVTNNGVADIGAVTFALSGTNAEQFSQMNDTCNATLAAGTSCSVDVVFTPNTSGTKTATLTATASRGGSASSILNGTGASQAALSISPSGTFGLINKGIQSTITFGVSNNGGVDSGIPMVSITGTPPGSNDFKLTGANTCVASIPAGIMNACYFSVTFTPTTTATEAATLNIAATPGGMTAMLTGNPLPSLQISPGVPSVNAPPGMTTSQMYTVSNTGTAKTGNLTITFSPAGAPFALAAGDTCSGKALDPMGGANPSCTFSVQYTAGVELGQIDRSEITVADSASDTVTAFISGQVLLAGVNLQLVSEGGPSVVPNFDGSNTIGFTLRNLGNAASAALNAPAVSAMQSSPDDLDMAFAISSNSCSSALMPGGECGFVVTFTAPDPSGEAGVSHGPFSGIIKVTDATLPNPNVGQLGLTGSD